MKLSPSRLSTFQRCGMKYHWSYVEFPSGDQQEEPDYMTIGSAVHAGLASYYEGKPWEEITNSVWLELAGSGAGVSDDRVATFEELIAFLGGYIDRDRDFWEVLEVETWKEGGWAVGKEQLGLVGKWDLLVKGNRGDMWIVDHKVSQQTRGATSYSYSLQAGMYLLQAKLLGIPVEGMIFNLINYKKGTSKQIVEQRSPAFLDNLQEEIEALYGRMGQRPVRSFGPNCHWDCNFAKLCLQRMENTHT